MCHTLFIVWCLPVYYREVKSAPLLPIDYRGQKSVVTLFGPLYIYRHYNNSFTLSPPIYIGETKECTPHSLPPIQEKVSKECHFLPTRSGATCSMVLQTYPRATHHWQWIIFTTIILVFDTRVAGHSATLPTTKGYVHFTVVPNSPPRWAQRTGYLDWTSV